MIGADTSTDDVDIAFIGGWGRSGSTLYSRMLGEVPGYVTVGEVRDVFLRGLTENRVCGCGKRFADCEFWGEVGDLAYGGWAHVDPARMAELRRLTDKPWHVPALLRPGLRDETDQALADYADYLLPLFRAMRDVTGAQVIVDTSKIASFGAILARIEGLQPRFLHLVRDARGTLYSWMKQVRMEDDPDTTRYMPRYNVAGGAARYVAYNQQMHLVGRVTGKRAPYTLFRYEDLVARPGDVMRASVAHVGVSADADFSSFLGPEGVKLGGNHTVIGNPMRHQSGWIPLRQDDAWREAMPPGQQRAITTLTSPMLLRYRYLPERSSR